MPHRIGVTPTAVQALDLPQLASLTPDQARGAICVWGSERLTAEIAVDLGEQSGPEGHWFPRACRDCAAARAHRALFEHAPMCEQCVDDAGRCEISLALYRLVRQGRAPQRQ
ncbi:hypothetical protein ACFWH4_01180 [Streptomyces sp. NPDC127091]|uniref:hypothetical protein n=1 Tax=Streptomyces sp. NPDC127091 TaxID=3347134 RepID=UPI003666AE58